MSETEINLTEREHKALQEISERTGKTQSELIQEAVNNLISNFQKEDRRSLMQKAQGLWKDRQDVPVLEDLRREWDRT
jgi:metal-responsive CopG/Arc/MetJ family transcriptional regulator